jgi:hypothetical protein
MPSHFGPGVPARRTCSYMYCFSSSLTVCQSSASSFATALTLALRQR